MEKVATDIKDCFILKLNLIKDERGAFIKTYSETLYNKLIISFEAKEEYFSISKKDVIRGFHFQVPPFDHDKIVYCPQGNVLDVIVDLRKGSDTYLKHVKVMLSDKEPLLVFIPKGCAHGFYSFEDNSVMVYKVSTEYAAEMDKGVHWNSFDIFWPTPFDEYIISERDSNLPRFSDFDNPFN